MDLRMMIVPLFIGLKNHPRWLFGILSINSSNLVIFDLSSLGNDLLRFGRSDLDLQNDFEPWAWPYFSMYWCIQTDDRNTNLTNLLGDDQRQLLSEDGGHHLICPGCPGGGAHGCRKEHFHCDSDWCEIWSCEGRGVGSNGWSCTTVEVKSTRFLSFFFCHMNFIGIWMWIKASKAVG